jgi:hypothetical protein
MYRRSVFGRGEAPLLVVFSLMLGQATSACESQVGERERRESTEPVEGERSAPPATEGGGATTGSAPPPPRPNPSAPKESEVPDLFDPDVIRDIELRFDEAALAVLSDPDPATKETWVHGSFKMGDIAFADVGVRRKGSFSYRVLPQKASFKIKLDKWVADQEVYGLSDLTLNNMVRSATCLAERLTFYTFRSLDLPAQRANTAHVTINGENYGVYANVETPNRRFLRRVLGDRANTLYEGNWGGEWLPGNEVSFEIDVADADAPAGTRPDLSALFQAVAAASDQDLLAGVSAHLHTTAWLRFAAAEAITAQRDGYAYSNAGSHNYFMIGDTDGKFALVPWSLDTTLTDYFGLVDAAVPLNETLFTRCKRGAICWNAYKMEMRSVVDAFEALDLASLAKKWHDQIDTLVRADPKREVSLAEYDDRTRQLYEWLAARPGIVRAQLGL